MIKDYAITLNGVAIPNIREVRVSIETPHDKRGIYREPTFAATVSVVRDASDNPIVEPFAMATNEDGRKNILTSGTKALCTAYCDAFEEVLALFT